MYLTLGLMTPRACRFSRWNSNAVRTSGSGSNGMAPCRNAMSSWYLYETSLALDKTHGARIVHRDLKPDNLFLCERERGAALGKVLDFGIAKIVSDAPTQANKPTNAEPDW